MNKISFRISTWIYLVVMVSVSFAPHVRAHELGCEGEIELGDLILLFMLSENESPSWRMQANNELICWLTVGIENSSAHSATRTGEVFIHVMGRRYSVLKQRVVALPWIVRLANPGIAKFPPDRVIIHPKMDCFGADGSGCDFALLPSLEAGGFSYEVLCENNEILTSTAVVYRVSHFEKQDAYLIYEFSSGSGGDTNSLQIFWNRDDALFAGCENREF